MGPPGRALAQRALGDVRARTAAFSLLFLAIAVANTLGYRSTYPTLADRRRLAFTFGGNKAARLFYGTPHGLETVGGFAAWRAGGILTIFAGFFGLLIAARAFAGEEESGRFELVATGAITRRTAFGARAAALLVALATVWLATSVGFAAGRLPVGGAAYLALSVVAVGVVYAAAGALASQLIVSRRGALELGGLALGIDFLLRVVSDTTSSQWLHWATPLGWAEELRPFADPRPVVLVLPAAAALILSGAALVLAERRDVGIGLLRSDGGARRPRTRLLGSPTAFAFRSERTTTAVWSVAVAAFGIVVGAISKSVASGLSPSLRQRLAEIGQADVATPRGYVGLSFLFFALAVSLYCCAQVAAARHEEAEGRLETLFALPQGRTGWLGGRIGVAAGGAAAISLAAAVGTAIGVAVVGADVSTAGLLEAGLNCLPTSLLALGVGALLFAVTPRHAVGAIYGLVSIAFVWELLGALVGAPSWLLGVSPFDHIGSVPASPFPVRAALVMVVLAVAAASGAAVVFRRRDLVGA